MVEHLKCYIGITEAARITGLSLTHLRVLIDSGSLPGFRDPVGRRLVLRTAVLRLAEERTRTLGSAARERTNHG